MDQQEEIIKTKKTISSIELDQSTIISNDETFHNLLDEMQDKSSYLQTEKRVTTQKKNNFCQRLGILYYILDGFQDPIQTLNIQNMKEVWLLSDSFKLKHISNSSFNDIFQKMIQNDLSYSEITKILLILSAKDSSYQIFESFGFLLNLLMIEKYNILLKKQNNLTDCNNQIGFQMNVFLSHIILSLKSQSLHLYFPVLIEQFNQAIECHINILFSSLKTVFSISSLSTLEHVVSQLMLFLQIAYPFSNQCKSIIQQDHFLYWRILIKKLVKYLYFPRSFDCNQFDKIVEFIINNLIPSQNN